MTLVSVIMPAKDRAALVSRAIASVRRQSIPFEIILIDDGSVPALSLQLSKADLEGVIVLRNDSCLNAAVSRNRGAEAASSEILAFLDSDDVWLPDHLERALNFLTLDERLIYLSPVKEGQWQFVKDPYEYLFGFHGDYRTSGIVCSKNSFNIIGFFDEDLFKHQDWDFVLRASQSHRICVGSNVTISLDHEAAGRMSGRPNLDASTRFIDQHFCFMTRNHVKVFFVGIIRVCLSINDLISLERCRSIMRNYLREDELDFVSRFGMLFPNFTYRVFKGRNHFRKIVSSVWARF